MPRTNFHTKVKEYRQTDKGMQPRLVWWPKYGRYLVTVHFSKDHIQSREMEVIHG